MVPLLAAVLLLAAPSRAAAVDPALQSAVEAAVAGFHGRVGVYARELSTGREAALDADGLYPTASIVKVPILASLLDRVDKGSLDYNAALVYTSTRARDAGDLAANLKDGAQVSPAKLAWLMESLSDNTAALWCQELAGGGTGINAWLEKRGFRRTRVNSRTPGREADYKALGWGQTTPREMAELLVAVATAAALSPAASEEMLRSLSRTYWDGEALSQIPPTVHVASKQGAVDHARSEVLLVDAPSGRYVLSVFTKEQADTRYVRDNEGYALLRRVSRAVWEALEASNSSWSPRAESVRFYHED